MILSYLRTEDDNKRKAIVKAHVRRSKREAASLDELIQIIRHLPPLEPEKKVDDKIVARKAGDVTYALQLPPEYRHSRPHPVLIVLHQAGEEAKTMLNRWSKAAAEHGYVLVAPQWQNGVGGNYTYSEGEHAAVLGTLKDLRRHFNVDNDRVFLSGLGEGGKMAFDVGLGHPDLFAGVLPIAAGPMYHAASCWRNGQYLPFYVVHGNRGPNGDRIRQQFETWVQRNFPMIWVDYKGRGTEWFAGEVPNMFDWMRTKKRAFPLRELGTNGGGGELGREFCTMRAGDNHFYWLSTDDVRRINNHANWKVRIEPATLHASIHQNTNEIIVNTSGLGQVTIWLGRNSRGEDMIDFDKPVTVRHNVTRLPWIRKKVTPSAEVLLEDLYQRGDRQQLFLAKIELNKLLR
jgi:predicted esterase